MKLNIKSFLGTALGAFIMAFALMVLLSPGHMAPGGVSAIALMVADALPIKAGTVLYILNIPLFLLAFKLDKKFFVNSLIGATFYSLFANLLSYLPPPEIDNILRSLFGGVAMGAGFGIIFACHSSTGGTDIIAWAINRKKPDLKLANTILAVDLCIIILQALIYKSLQSALFAALALYISSKTIDKFMEGAANYCKTVYIISDQYGEISRTIFEKLHRGVTALAAKGMYTGDKKQVLFCSVSVRELYTLKKIISDIDSDAFVIVSDAREVLGKGFNNIVV